MKNVFILMLMSLAFGKTVQAQAPNWAWAKGAGSAGNDMGKAIKTDPNGNSFVTGRFSATATFGSLSVSSYGGPDIFVAKYNDNGNCVWVRHGGSTDNNDIYGDEGDGIALDNFGNCYVTGNFHDTATFDG